MEKNHLTLLHFDQKEPRIYPKKEALVLKKMLMHLENEEVKLTNFETSINHASFTFSYGKNEIVFDLEHVIDTMILDFDGKGMSEALRIKASGLLEGVVEALRFRHKDKFWSLSHYYIDDLIEYSLRKDPDYPVKHHEEWKKILNLSKVEAMDESDRLFFEVEGVHDLELKIVGEDGKVLCDYLKQEGHIDYRSNGENGYIIELLDVMDELDGIHRKIIFAREIAYFGYNIWVDYSD